MTVDLHIKFEKALRLLADHLPISEKNSRKSVLFHDIRVGAYLYEKNYSEDIVLAGVLHDAIEWSDISENTLREEFGDRITKLVLANTKNDSITDPIEKTKELILRCIDAGQDALIVKAADMLDSFKWYASQNNTHELAYCMRNANEIFTYMPKHFTDKVFDELKTWQKKFSFLEQESSQKT